VAKGKNHTEKGKSALQLADEKRAFPRRSAQRGAEVKQARARRRSEKEARTACGKRRGQNPLLRLPGRYARTNGTRAGSKQKQQRMARLHFIYE